MPGYVAPISSTGDVILMATELLVLAQVPAVARHPQARVIAGRLGEIHRQWLDETREWLAPAMAPDADFWNGWSAVRYLADQFERLYRRQLAFVKAMLPMCSSSEAFALAITTVRLERARRNLDQLGRQQGMVEVVAAACAHFLDLLEAWFEELQRLIQGLTRAELPVAAQQALAQLQAAIASRAELPSRSLTRIEQEPKIA
jgi:hypothetical protein